MAGKFKRELNTLDILVVAFGAMIGWGWVVSSGTWIQNGGVLGTVLGFFIGGIMIYFVGLVYAELTTSLPKCGGQHVFSYVAFGSVGSYMCTWALILSYIGVVCFEACSFPTILQYIFPNMRYGYLYTVAGFDVYASWVLIATIMTVLITGINIIGIKKSAIFQTTLTAIIALTGLCLFLGALFNGSTANLCTQAFNSDGNLYVNIIKVAIMTPFFLFGFDVIPQTAEEINVPFKKLGRLMLLSIILAVLFYVMVVFSIGLIMDKAMLNVSMTTSGLVTADAMAKAFNSQMMAKVLIIGGLCGIVTSWNAFLIGGSRALYSMAASYMIPHQFSVIHREHKTPVTALILLGVLSLIAPFFGKAMLIWIVDAANFACCAAYFIISVAYIVIRKKYPLMKRPYKNKHYIFVGVSASIMSGIMAVMYIIPGTSCSLVWQEWTIVGSWTVMGGLFALWSKHAYKEKFASHIYDTHDITEKNIIENSKIFDKQLS